ncbi:hypothetical protein [Cellulomonas sp. KH9]|uniref:hypothetical protein n=1 Tax=Cellulomonas sp. KH9 TaxID=1855324 RepID=UPI0008E18CE6|nr:hypothetical protein [Cellulomonas sp. KH9]SFJ64834.1 hypothetical protein SAMN05216467_0336 [Cellulomonas sp. KH9]
MGVDEEFERVRTALRTEEQALAQEFERIDAEARATIDASVEHVRTELATQADRIREAIAQQRAEVEARTEELSEELTEAAAQSAPDGGAVPHDEDVADDEGVDDDEGAAVVADGTVVEETAVTAGEDVTDDIPADYPDDIEWDEEPVTDATRVEQADGTDVDRMTTGGDDLPPAGTVDGVERGD